MKHETLLSFTFETLHVDVAGGEDKTWDAIVVNVAHLTTGSSGLVPWKLFSAESGFTRHHSAGVCATVLYG